MICQKCRKELDESIMSLSDHEIETVNCIFHLCLECNIQIEGWIEDYLKGDVNI